MPFKDLQKRKEYGRKYHFSWYSKHREEKLVYRKARREKDREIYRKWSLNKKNQERKEKISSGRIYKPKIVFSSRKGVI
ncbi:MAG: hypothetical protein Q8P13_00045 [bacterium]|nr:hypothetical protein [bacterium]